MRTHVPLLSGIALLSLLTGCMRAEVPTPDSVIVDDVPASPNSTQVTEELVGVIEDAGVSVYMEGTHRLMIDETQMVLLESAVFDLNQYVGMRVRVHGLVRPTVEAGGMILSVDALEVIEGASSSSQPLLEPVEPESSSSSSVEALPVRSSAPAEPVKKSSSSKAEVFSVKTSSSVIPFSSSSSALSSPEEADKHVAAMAKAKVDAANFTQLFCSRHAGFCVPLHKSWFYHAFGATSTFLWHVEVSSEEVEELGDGPLVINLVAGALDGQQDGSVAEQGETVIGYRAWTNNRHFEISAPSDLKAAVAHMTENLTVYQTDATASSATSASSSLSSASSSL